MRAQLAVSSLIVFGLVLIGLGAVQLPYVATVRETLVFQTYTHSPTRVEEVYTTVTTSETSTLTRYTTTDIVSTTEVLEKVENVTQSLGSYQNIFLKHGSPYVLGQFVFNTTTELLVDWRAGDEVELYVYLLGQDEESWQPIGRGVSGLINVTLSGSGPWILSAQSLQKDTTLEKLTLTGRWQTTSQTTITKTTTQLKTVAYTTTLTQLQTFSYTTIYETLWTSYYTTALETIFTETRYAELWFMTVTGSFLVFVGILLILLLLKMSKPILLSDS